MTDGKERIGVEDFEAIEVGDVISLDFYEELDENPVMITAEVVELTDEGALIEDAGSAEEWKGDRYLLDGDGPELRISAAENGSKDHGLYYVGWRHVGSDPDSLALGTVAEDIEGDEGGDNQVVVTGHPEVSAKRYVIRRDREGLPVSVADVNPEIDPDDRVVEVVYREMLDGLVTDWSDKLSGMGGEEFVVWLEDYQDKWGVHLSEYAFPVSRLKPVEAADRD